VDELERANVSYETKILPSNIEKLKLVQCQGLWNMDGNRRDGCGAYTDCPDQCTGSPTSGHIRTNLFKVKGKWFSIRAAYREAVLSITEVDDAINGTIYRPQIMYITCYSELVSELKLMGVSDEAFLKVIPAKTFSRIKGNVLKKLLDHGSSRG
jgi:hypothetical protein